MSERPPPAVAGSTPVHREEALTPEAIESVLAEFRSWLQEEAAAGRAEPAPLGPPEGEEAIDLHTLLGQFIALRHEVNLQTRAVRAQQEQNAETLRQLGQTVAMLNQAPAAPPPQPAAEDQLRPVLKALVDVYDALSLAGREAQRVQGAVLSSLEQLPEAADAAPRPRPAGLSAWFGLGAREPEPTAQPEQRQKLREAAGRAREFLDSLLTGYTMSLRRVERVLQQYQLEPIPAVGRPFDPEQMEAVEVVSDSGRPAGEVVDEVRRGYNWRGRVFRHAQVRVAR